MTTGAGTTGATLAWVVWEWARWQEFISWGVGITGALVVLAVNVLRLIKEIKQRRDNR